MDETDSANVVTLEWQGVKQLYNVPVMVYHAPYVSQDGVPRPHVSQDCATLVGSFSNISFVCVQYPRLNY